MNLLRTVPAFIAIFAAASPAFATTILHVVGSTSYRGPTNLAILKSFDSTTTVAVGTTHADFTKSAISYFHGTMSGVDTIVETNFNGSVGGIKAVTAGTALNFFSDTLDQTSGATVNITASASPTIPAFSSGSGLNSAPSSVNTVAPEVVMSDVWQATTIYTTPVLTGAVITGQPAGKVGVVPYVWIRTPSASSSVSALVNMNRQTTNVLYGNGTLPLALWSGNAADETSLVYAAGRNPYSGTRIATFANSSLGANATVVQYRPSAQNSTPVSGISQTGSITAVEYWPNTTVTDPAGTFNDANAGEGSGSELVAYMSKAFNIGTAGAMVAYCATTDAGEAIKNGAVPLKWRGVQLVTSYSLGSSPTFNYDLIRNGKYNFWGYEFMYYPSGTSTARKTAANKIANQLYSTDAQLLISSMRVSRRLDGGFVGPEY